MPFPFTSHSGGNYGWNIVEAVSCYRHNAACGNDRLESPITFYDHSEGCSITGGYVYRGTRLPALAGACVFGDFCSGRIWALRYNGESVTEKALLADTDLGISSFGVASDGELYVLDLEGGTYHLVLE